jgi:DeoR/GlpR family transcriptional regulator of sugar metabolism
MAFAGIDGVSVDPGITGDGMTEAADSMASAAGRNLLSALHSVANRDAMARRDVLVAP